MLITRSPMMTETYTFPTPTWSQNNPLHALQALLWSQEISQTGRRTSGPGHKRKGRLTSAIKQTVESLFQNLPTSKLIFANTLVSEDLSVFGYWGISGYRSICLYEVWPLFEIIATSRSSATLGKVGKFEGG